MKQSQKHQFSKFDPDRSFISSFCVFIQKIISHHQKIIMYLFSFAFKMQQKNKKQTKKIMKQVNQYCFQ